MKKASIIFGLFLLLGVASCGNESVDTVEVSDENPIESGEQEASIEQVKVVAIANDSILVSIKGMSCMINCVSSVKKELRNTVGIATVTVDFDPEREVDEATITFDNKQIDQAKIKTIIEGINGGQYVVTEIKPATEEEAKENVSSENETAAVSNTSSFSIIDQVQNIARTDFEIPNIFQILNAIF
jgi:copper chaperone CopZ